MRTHLQGVLEIDHERGVIYFHLTDNGEIMKRQVVTPLRISNLPTPIPPIEGRCLDITHLVNTDWRGQPGFTQPDQVDRTGV